MGEDKTNQYLASTSTPEVAAASEKVNNRNGTYSR